MSRPLKDRGRLLRPPEPLKINAFSCLEKKFEKNEKKC